MDYSNNASSGNVQAGGDFDMSVSDLKDLLVTERSYNSNESANVNVDVNILINLNIFANPQLIYYMNLA